MLMRTGGIVAQIALACCALDAQADSRAPTQDTGRAVAPGSEVVSAWLARRFTPAELASLPKDSFRTESHFCGCYDRPEPHFPYSVVVFNTPRGDLVTRAEGHEGEIRITPIAVRTGDRYCSADAESECFGDFPHPCDFTDFRFGPALAPYFPSCKSAEP